MSAEREFILGGVELYLAPYNPELTDPDDIIDEVCQEENLYGESKNGATLLITPTYYNVKDDLGRTNENMLTAIAGTLQAGLIKVGPKILNPLLETSRVSISKKGDGKVLTVGGIESATGQKYNIVARHISKEKGDIYVVVVGKNNSELQFQFNPESETILNPTFTCTPMDKDASIIHVKFVDPEMKSD